MRISLVMLLVVISVSCNIKKQKENVWVEIAVYPESISIHSYQINVYYSGKILTKVGIREGDEFPLHFEKINATAEKKMTRKERAVLEDFAERMCAFTPPLDPYISEHAWVFVIQSEGCQKIVVTREESLPGELHDLLYKVLKVSPVEVDIHSLSMCFWE